MCVCVCVCVCVFVCVCEVKEKECFNERKAVPVFLKVQVYVAVVFDITQESGLRDQAPSISMETTCKGCWTRPNQHNGGKTWSLPIASWSVDPACLTLLVARSIVIRIKLTSGVFRSFEVAGGRLSFPKNSPSFVQMRIVKSMDNFECLLRHNIFRGCWLM